MKTINPHMVLFFALLINASSFASTKNSQATHDYVYIMPLKAPNQITIKSPITAFYNGKPLVFENNRIIFKDMKQHAHVAILITAQQPKPLGQAIKYSETDTTLRGFKIDINKPLIWWNLTLSIDTASDPGKSFYTWTIKELSKNEVPSLVANDATIIIQLDPSLCKQLECQSSCKATIRKNGEVTLIDMPQLVLKESISQQELDDSCNKIALATCETRLFHRKDTCCIHQDSQQPLTRCIKS